MVAPLVIAGVAMAVGAIMQYYNSEKARGATAERLKQIEELFNKVKPPDIDLSVYDDPKLAGTIPPAAYDFSKITPEEFKLVANIAPEAAPYVAEKAPQLVEASQAATEGRSAQLDALRRYKQIASGEGDPQFQQAMLEASRKGRQDAQSRQASILQNFQRRGLSGPGAELALEAQGSSDAMQRAAIESQRAAADSYRNRLEALARGAQLGGQVRDSEMGEAKTNASIINDYNQRASARYQDYLQSRADAIYRARVAQEEMKQRISDANVTNRNKYASENLDRRNQLVGQQRNQRADEAERQLKLAQAKAGVQQQIFANDMDIRKAKAGIQSQGIDYLRSDAQDRNQQISSMSEQIGNIGLAAYKYRSKEQPAPPADSVPDYNIQSDPYDEGTTPGNYRRSNSDLWRTV